MNVGFVRLKNQKIFSQDKNRQPIKIAVTGGIATGKTTIISRLCKIYKKSCIVFSSDHEISNLYKNKIIISKISKTLQIPSHQVNKQNVSQIILKQPNKLRQIENILYPELAKKRRLFIIQNSKIPIHLFEIPLFFEKKLWKSSNLKFDLILIAKNDFGTREKFITKRGIPKDYLTFINKHQYSYQIKRKIQYNKAITSSKA